jgi:iron complex outermembrane receptor protein
MNWQFTDNMKLQSITAWTNQDADSVVDWDNSQYDLVLDINRSTLEVRSEELQLTGGRGKVDWLAGVYYWDQTGHTRNGRWQVNEFQKGLMDVNNVLNSPACNPPGGVPAGYQNCQQVYDGAVRGAYDTMSIAEQDGWAVFGEATIHLTDTLDLTLGLREHDQSGYSQNLAPIPGVTAPKPLDPTQFHVGGDPFAGVKVGVPNEFQFDKLTSRFALQKQFNDSVMGYIAYSEGFNSGGVSAPIINGVRTEFPFKPSTLKNSEIGMRSDLAGGKVRFNWTLFDTIWADLQAAGVVYDPVTHVQIPTLVTTNVGEAEAKGVEIELSFVPTENLFVSLGMGLLDTAYTKILPGTMTGHLPLTTGTEFQDAPDKSYTIGFQHTANLNGGASFITRLDYNYQGQFWRSEPFLRVSGYAAVPDGYDESGDWGLLNLRFTYEPAEANWQASFFGTNLTDEYTINSGFFHGIWGYDFATVGRPREYGASLTFRF